MTKVTVVAQAPYPVSVDSGRHLEPGEIASVNRTPAVEEAFVTGFLREVPEAAKPQRTPAPSARDENKDN